MGERRGTKALELWCRRITEGYPGVKIDNMTTSWKNGLGFCAMIHHFRPDLIEFEKLNKNDIYYNNDLAFRTAEISLGIPALLDAADMEAYEVPDRLSILTYLSQFYQRFAGQDSTNRLKRMSSNAEKSSISKTPGPPPKMAHIVGVPKREPCKKCSLPIFLAERVNVGKQVYHRTCLKCARCNSQLSIGNFYETEIDGEFCCETCPDEETNFPSSLSTATSSNKVQDENQSYNNIGGGYRSSIADRLNFFERSNDSSLLQKSVTDEEKRKSLEKITAQYKPNKALSSFMNTTLGDAPNHTSNFKIELNVNKNTQNSSESSDEDNEEISVENIPPALPKDGPPTEYIDDVDNIEENDALSITVESKNTTANNNATINQNEQTANINAPNYVSNSKVLLSLSNKNIKSNLTQNHNHYNTDNNIINNNLNLSSNVTKDISNNKTDDTQTGNKVNTESESTTPNSMQDIFKDLNSITSQYVELRNQTESPLKFNKENNSKSTNYIPNSKVDLTEQRLSVVRTRLQQFEEVLKSGGGINNSTKSTISINSSNNVNNIENSKLNDKPIENTAPHINKNDVVNVLANKDSEQNTKELSITEESDNNLKQNELEKIVLNIEDQSTNAMIKNSNEVKHEEKTENLTDQIDGEEEINIEEQTKLSEDIKQVGNIKENVSEEVNETEIENTELIAEINSELTLKNENIKNVSVEIDEIQEENESIPCEDRNKISEFDVNIKKNIEKKQFDTMVADVSEQSTLKDIITNSKSEENLKINEEIEYPEELNPFASDEEDENLQVVNTTNKDSILRNQTEQNDKKSSDDSDRRKSLNPFDSSDEDAKSGDHNTEKGELKLKPPRPPPPKISKNPFGSDSEEEENTNIPHSGNTSIISTDSNRRGPVPTPRSQLTPSGKNNLTPEPTPRPSRQNYYANNRTEYYGSNISLNTSITSPTGHDSFNRYNDTRSSNNSLASSAGGSSGFNTMRSKKKKAPAPPPPTMPASDSSTKASKELFPANDVESKKSTPTSSSTTTPQMSRKKRPAPKPPTPVKSNTLTVAGTSTALTNSKNISSSKDNLVDTLNQVDIEKLSDEEKAAHRDNRQFFLEATSTSSKVSEIYKKEDTSLEDISTNQTSSVEPSQIINQKTGGVECSELITDKLLTSNSDNLDLNTNQNIVTNTPEECYKSQTKIHSLTNNNILVEASADDIQHDRHIEKIKDNKESKNRNRQSQPYNEDIQNETTSLYNKSTHGKWKRRKGPAPLLPVPPRKILQMLPLQEIRHELEIIEVQQQGLEKQGVVLETMIRERCEGKNGELINGCGDPNEKQTNSKEVEDLILQLFELVNEKNDLFRRQAELMYLRRQHRLEQEQADLEYEIRVLMAQPEKNKTDSDKAREEALITRLVEVVQLRNEVIECLDMDRLREAEEDLSIKQRLEMHTAKRDEELCKQTPTKLSKKEKKKQKELKKLGKSKQIDADKDADESEINVEVQKKKKRKFLFNVLTSSSKSE